MCTVVARESAKQNGEEHLIVTLSAIRQTSARSEITPHVVSYHKRRFRLGIMPADTMDHQGAH